MKNHYLFSIVFLSLSINAFAQYSYKAKWEEWSDSTAFAKSDKSIVKGIGVLSDSISQANNNKIVYTANNEYYIINNLGDYYLWFLDRYPDLFTAPAANYHYYYLMRDNYNMCLFVSQNYMGRHFPIPFKTLYGETKVRYPQKQDYGIDQKEQARRNREIDAFNKRNRIPTNNVSKPQKPQSKSVTKKKIGSN